MVFESHRSEEEIKGDAKEEGEVATKEEEKDKDNEEIQQLIQEKEKEKQANQFGEGLTRRGSDRAIIRSRLYH